MIFGCGDLAASRKSSNFAPAFVSTYPTRSTQHGVGNMSEANIIGAWK